MRFLFTFLLLATTTHVLAQEEIKRNHYFSFDFSPELFAKGNFTDNLDGPAPEMTRRWGAGVSAYYGKYITENISLSTGFQGRASFSNNRFKYLGERIDEIGAFQFNDVNITIPLFINYDAIATDKSLLTVKGGPVIDYYHVDEWEFLNGGQEYEILVDIYQRDYLNSYNSGIGKPKVGFQLGADYKLLGRNGNPLILGLGYNQGQKDIYANNYFLEDLNSNVVSQGGHEMNTSSLSMSIGFGIQR